MGLVSVFSRFVPYALESQKAVKTPNRLAAGGDAPKGLSFLHRDVCSGLVEDLWAPGVDGGV